MSDTNIIFEKHMTGANNIQGYNFESSTDNFPSSSPVVTTLRRVIGNEADSCVMELESVEKTDGTSGLALICSHKTGSNGESEYTYTEAQMCCGEEVGARTMLSLMAESNFLTKEAFSLLSENVTATPSFMEDMARVEDDIVNIDEYNAAREYIAPELFAPKGMLYEELSRFTAYLWKSCTARRMNVACAPIILRVPGVSTAVYKGTNYLERSKSRVSSVPVGVEFIKTMVLPHLPQSVRNNILSFAFGANRTTINQMEDDVACFVTEKRYAGLSPQLDLVEKKLTMGIGTTEDELSAEGIEIGHFLMQPDKKTWPVYFQFQQILGKNHIAMADFDLFELLCAVEKILDKPLEERRLEKGINGYRQLEKIGTMYSDIPPDTVRSLLMPLEKWIVETAVYADVKPESRGCSFIAEKAFSIAKHNVCPGEDTYQQITGRDTSKNLVMEAERNFVEKMIEKSFSAACTVLGNISDETKSQDYAFATKCITDFTECYGIHDSVLTFGSFLKKTGDEENDLMANYRQDICRVLSCPEYVGCSLITQKDILDMSAAFSLDERYLRERLRELTNPEDNDNWNLVKMLSLYEGKDSGKSVEELLRVSTENLLKYVKSLMGADTTVSPKESEKIMNRLREVCDSAIKYPRVIGSIIDMLAEISVCIAPISRGQSLSLTAMCAGYDSTSDTDYLQKLLSGCLPYLDEKNRIDGLKSICEALSKKEANAVIDSTPQQINEKSSLWNASLSFLPQKDIPQGIEYIGTYSLLDAAGNAEMLLDIVKRQDESVRLFSFKASVKCMEQYMGKNGIMNMFVSFAAEYIQDSDKLDAMSIILEKYKLIDENTALMALTMAEKTTPRTLSYIKLLQSRCLVKSVKTDEGFISAAKHVEESSRIALMDTIVKNINHFAPDIKSALISWAASFGEEKISSALEYVGLAVSLEDSEELCSNAVETALSGSYATLSMWKTLLKSMGNTVFNQEISRQLVNFVSSAQWKDNASSLTEAELREEAALTLLLSLIEKPCSTEIIEKLLCFVTSSVGISKAVDSVVSSQIAQVPASLAYSLISKTAQLPERRKAQTGEKLSCNLSKGLNMAETEKLTELISSEKDYEKLKLFLQFTQTLAMPKNSFSKVIVAVGNGESATDTAFPLLAKALENADKNDWDYTCSSCENALKAAVSTKGLVKYIALDDFITVVDCLSKRFACTDDFRSSLLNATDIIKSDEDKFTVLNKLWHWIEKGVVTDDDKWVINAMTPCNTLQCSEVKANGAAFAEANVSSDEKLSVMDHILYVLNDYSTDQETCLQLLKITEGIRAGSSGTGCGDTALRKLMNYFDKQCHQNDYAKQFVTDVLLQKYGPQLQAMAAIPDFIKNCIEKAAITTVENYISSSKELHQLYNLPSLIEMPDFVSRDFVTAHVAKNDEAGHTISEMVKKGAVSIAKTMPDDDAVSFVEHYYNENMPQDVPGRVVSAVCDYLFDKIIAAVLNFSGGSFSGILGTSHGEMLRYSLQKLKKPCFQQKALEQGKLLGDIELQLQLYQSLKQRTFTEDETLWKILQSAPEKGSNFVSCCRVTATSFQRETGDITLDEERLICLMSCITSLAGSSSADIQWDKYFSQRLGTVAAHVREADPYANIKNSLCPLDEVSGMFAYLDNIIFQFPMSECMADLRNTLLEGLKTFLTTSMRIFTKKARDKRSFQKYYGIKMNRDEMVQFGFSDSFIKYITSFFMR